MGSADGTASLRLSGTVELYGRVRNWLLTQDVRHADKGTGDNKSLVP